MVHLSRGAHNHVDRVAHDNELYLMIKKGGLAVVLVAFIVWLASEGKLQKYLSFTKKDA